MKFEQVNCKDVMIHICENLNEDIDSDRCRAMRHHIEQCETCRDYGSSIECIIEWYREYDPGFTPDQHNDLLKKLDLL